MWLPGARDSWASQVALVVKNPPANIGDIRDMGLIPASGRSAGGRHGNPLQYSCLGNPMDSRPQFMGSQTIGCGLVIKQQQQWRLTWVYGCIFWCLVICLCVCLCECWLKSCYAAVCMKWKYLRVSESLYVWRKCAISAWMNEYHCAFCSSWSQAWLWRPL